MVWLVRIGAVNPSRSAPKQAPQVVASGAIRVQHPSVNPSAATTALQARPAPPARVALQLRMSKSTAIGSAPQRSVPHTIPNLSSLSAVKGQLYDPVLIDGANLGRGGEVHFVVGPGTDMKVVADAWNVTQVMAHVPAVVGLAGYAGKVYLVTNGPNPQKTNELAFEFIPTMDFVDLKPLCQGAFGGWMRSLDGTIRST